ncbi:MAG: flagellar biosynthesis protein FlhA [Candidatus Margulisiibacteriota bacterium]
MATAVSKVSLKDMFQISEVMMAAVMVLIISLMVIPLPFFMLDMLMSVNLAISLAILLFAMYLQRPLDFATFPSILLIVTLFRLSLNIASTRLILAYGADFDGKIVLTFAEYVTKGNYVVGAVVFLIITVVQFVVITKGSERVAEVAARFTLDAMPGKQMSIDADLNAGIIDANDAKERRRTLERESTFFGSMDGANKFVRGDAVAGIIIVIVNIIGGLIIGAMQLGYPLMEALEIFGKLTIGDGLISQIPALLISIATGLVITKAASEMSLGKDVAAQIFAQPRVFAFTGIIIAMLAFVPGMPKLVMISISVLLATFTLYMFRRKVSTDAASHVGEAEVARAAMKTPENLLGTLALDPIALKTGRNLVPLIDPSMDGPLLERITLVRYHVGQELGFVIPGVRVMDDLSLGPNEYQVEIRGTRVAIGEALVNHYLVLTDEKELEAKGISGQATKDYVTSNSATWVSEEYIQQLKDLSITTQTPVDSIANHFMEIIKRHADEIITRQNVQSLIELVKNTNAAIVRELIPDMLSLGQVHKVLQILVKERVSIRDLSTILERLADYAHVTRDTNLLAEYIRQSLARQICSVYIDEENTLTVLTIDPRLEETMIGAVHQSEYGSFLALDPNVGERLLVQINSYLKEFIKLNRVPLTLCSPRLRPHFKRFTERNFPQMAVLSYNEVVPEIKVQSIGILTSD